MNIAITSVFIGKQYREYSKNFLESFSKKFCPNDKVTFYILTDNPNLAGAELNNVKIKIVDEQMLHDMNYDFSRKYCLRYLSCVMFREELLNNDFTFIFNANAVCIREINLEDICPSGKMCVCCFGDCQRLTQGVNNKLLNELSDIPGIYDRINLSVSEKKYYQSGSFGGKSDDVLNYINSAFSNILKDYSIFGTTYLVREEHEFNLYIHNILNNDVNIDYNSDFNLAIDSVKNIAESTKIVMAEKLMYQDVCFQLSLFGFLDNSLYEPSKATKIVILDNIAYLVSNTYLTKDDFYFQTKVRNTLNRTCLLFSKQGNLNNILASIQILYRSNGKSHVTVISGEPTFDLFLGLAFSKITIEKNKRTVIIPRVLVRALKLRM